MDFQQLLDKYSPFLKRNILILSLGFLGMIFFAYGLISLLAKANSTEEIVFESGQEEISEIKIDIQGAVIKPGVYALKSDARLQDIFVLAGGMAEDADRDWVAKNLNMAQRLEDGGKVYIPGKGDAESIKSITGIKGININSASEKELDSLPGVGTVTSQKIIDNRPYATIDELLSKKIVGSKVFGEIKDKISIY